MYNQGQFTQPNSTAFTKLKDYIDYKAQWNVNVNMNRLVDEFFAGQFKDAAGPMRRFYDMMIVHLRTLEENYGAALTTGRNIYSKLDIPDYWPKHTLETWMGLIDEAFGRIDKYKKTDPELYAKLYDNILIESIFPRTALIELYKSTYSTDVYEEMVQQFKEDTTRLRVARYSENLALSVTADSLY